VCRFVWQNARMEWVKGSQIEIVFLLLPRWFSFRQRID
jgi:hypothetical protein